MLRSAGGLGYSARKLVWTKLRHLAQALKRVATLAGSPARFWLRGGVRSRAGATAFPLKSDVDEQPALPEELLKAFFVVGEIHGSGGRDLALADEAVEVLFECGLPAFAAFPHHLVDFAGVIVFDGCAGG